MKVYILGLLLAVVLAVECSHTFMGTSVSRRLIFSTTVRYSANRLTKRIEYFNYTVPYKNYQRIRGILAYDLTKTGASANVTAGGLNTNHVTLRMKSDRAKPLRYDIHIYV